MPIANYGSKNKFWEAHYYRYHQHVVITKFTVIHLLYVYNVIKSNGEVDVGAVFDFYFTTLPILN